MAKDNSRIVSMIEKGKTSEEIKKATRAPIMRIAGVRAAHTRLHSKRRAANGSKAKRKMSAGKISLKPGSDAHKLVMGLLKKGVEAKVIAAAAGRAPGSISAIKAHMTMGTY